LSGLLLQGSSDQENNDKKNREQNNLLQVKRDKPFLPVFKRLPALLSICVKRNNMKYEITALLIITLLCGPVAAASSKVSFPGILEAPDPTEQYAVTWLDAKPHELFFKEIKNSKLRHLLSFNRHVDVFWAPNGDALAITDWGGSDYSDAFIYFPSRLNKRINLKHIIKKTFGLLPEVAKNHHVYFEVLEWINSDLLEFDIHGYGDYSPDGFEKIFEYNLKDAKIRQK
jgi:hypothetical protein